MDAHLYGQDEDKLRITYKGKDIALEVGVRGNSIPLIGHVQIKKAMKSSICSYLVFAQESKDEDNVNVKHVSFLQQFNDCFSESIPGELPPERPDNVNDCFSESHSRKLYSKSSPLPSECFTTGGDHETSERAAREGYGST